MGKLHEESFHFLSIYRSVLDRMEIRVLIYFYFENEFQLFTVLPLISNAYKMLILTPIRSVQIALDS